MKTFSQQDIQKLEKLRKKSRVEILPMEVRNWADSLPLDQRRYILSLCYLMGAVPREIQLDFLNNYATDSLVAKMLHDQAHQQVLTRYLNKFCIEQDLDELVFKNYIKQFYIHLAQDLKLQPDLYLETVVRLIYHAEERNILFNYILGFEVLKMIFQMSWLEHERLYRLQRNQERFIRQYIKPIQHAHRINGIIVPKHENIFFAQRNYFIKKPNIPDKKLVELVMATFTKATVINLGFLIIRHLNFLVFDYEYIFNSEPECIFYM